MASGQSQFAGLSPKILKEIERRLSKPGFNSYRRLAEWLERQGFRISIINLRNFKARLGRAGTKTRPQKAQRGSRTWNGTAEGLISLARQKLGSALAEVDQFQQGDMSRLAHAVAHLIQAGVALQRWQAELSRRSGGKVARGEPHLRVHGLTGETSQTLRNALLGIVPGDRDAQEREPPVEAVPDVKPDRRSETERNKR